VPVISQSPGLAEKGALMTLVADPVEQGQLTGVHAIQILNGQKAFTLPVRTPRKVSFIVNMKSAKAMGIKVPISTLENATTVIK
jgi:putative ABC transport system substrate-binding protein